MKVIPRLATVDAESFIDPKAILINITLLILA